MIEQASTQVQPSGGIAVAAPALTAAPVDNTVAIRVSRLEGRIEQAEGRLQVAEHVYTCMINEINSLREQCGMPALDHSYYQP
jgi:hypothetical protein